jgi:hypothetical protein
METNWFPSGKYRRGLDWNFPETRDNLSPSVARIRQHAGFRRFPREYLPALKPYHGFSESPDPALFKFFPEFPDGY